MIVLKLFFFFELTSKQQQHISRFERNSNLQCVRDGYNIYVLYLLKQAERKKTFFLFYDHGVE